MKLRNKKGFTIVELVIVIAVIAILAAVLIPTFAGLVEKANRSVDMQLVKSMNDILITEEVTGNKPVTVVDAKKILSDNGISQFKPVASNNVFYWVGTDNRVLLWEKDEEAATGKVTYPEDSKKKYETYTQPSADWSNLSEEQSITNITPAEGEDVKTALLTALQKAEDGAILRLPANQVIDMGGKGSEISNALAGQSGVGKSISIDLNGCTLNDFTTTSSCSVPKNGNLQLSNGTINGKMPEDSNAALVAKSGACLVLRDVNINISKGAAIYPNGDASEVVIDKCNISGITYGVGTNAMYSDNIRITITDSSIKAYCAVLINTKSNVKIENSNIVSTNGWGLFIREGFVTVSNSTITAEDSDVGTGSTYSCGYRDFAYTQNSSGAPFWGQGYQVPYSVVTVGDYSNGTSYDGAANLTMNNVKIITPNADDIPDIVLAAQKSGKTVSVAYDDSCTIANKIVIFGDSYSRTGVNHTFTHDGTITVNGKTVTLESGTTKIAD